MDEIEKVRRFRIWMPFLFIGFLAATNRAAANPIVVTYYWFRGVSLFLPAALFVTVVEGLVLSRILKMPRRPAFGFSFALNVLSAAACYPILLFAADWYQDRLSRNLYIEQLHYLPFRITEYSILFVGSVITEFLGGIATGFFMRRLKFATGRFAAAILLGNTLTYLVLSPIAYHLGAPPDRGSFSWTPDTSWAIRPPVQVIYTTDEKTLATIDADGSGARTLLPFPVESYLFSHDLNHFVYIQQSDHHGESLPCYFDCQTQTRTILPGNFGGRGLDCVDLSPSGKRIASLQLDREGDHSTETLKIYNVIEGRVQETVVSTDLIDRLGSDRRIAWSNREDVLYIRYYRDGLKPGETVESHTRYVRLDLLDDEIVSKRELESPDEISLCDNYGPFHYFVMGHWGGPDLAPNLVSEEGDVRLYFGKGRISAFDLTRHVGGFLEEDGPFDIFAFTKIILKRPSGEIAYDTRREIREGILIHKGRECIIGDGHCLYLVDLENRRIGVLTSGATNPILLTPAFQKQTTGFMVRSTPLPGKKR